MKVNEFDNIVNEALKEEAKKYILENQGGYDVFEIQSDNKPIEYCENEVEAANTLGEYKKNHPERQFTIKKNSFETKEDLFDKLDSMCEDFEENNQDMKKDKNTQDCKECDTEMKENKACETCGKEICECGELTESKKKTIRLTESKLIKLIETMVNETVKGMQVTKKAQSDSKKFNNEYARDVKKKMDDYADFEGNDKPEFPMQVGSGEKEAYKNTSEQEKEIEENRGSGNEDLKYDYEPSKKFKERAKGALKGDQKMGNKQEDTGNTTKSDVGNNLLDKAERKQKKEEDKSLYKKDVQPVKTVSESKLKTSDILLGEIAKMQNLYKHDKKSK